MGYRNIGFAPMQKAKAEDEKRDSLTGLPVGAIVVGHVPVSYDENMSTAEIIVRVATDVRDKAANVGQLVTLGDGAAVFVAQVFADMKLRVINQAEYETLVRVFRGFEVCCNRLAIVRNQQN